MIRTVLAFAAACVAVLLSAGCVTDVQPTNTGYEGTWSIGNERATTVVAIVKDGERYLHRLTIHSADGKWQVRCNWDGICEEFVDHRKTSDFRFRTWTDEDTGHLIVECTGKVFHPKEREIHYVNELVTEPDGLTLWSYTLERAGQSFRGDARPKRSLTKVSDGVADPPRLDGPKAGRNE